jgi:hypothetical protein
MPVRWSDRKTITVVAGFSLLMAGTALSAADPESAPPAAAAAPAAPSERAAVGLPTFRVGLWEYRRTSLKAGTTKPQVSTVRKCTDPGAEMREKMETLAKKGCQFAPLKRSSDRYISSWTCQTPTGAIRFRDVLRAKDADSYEDLSETHTAHHVTQQKIEAMRVGECPGLGSGAPLKPTRKPRTHGP